MLISARFERCRLQGSESAEAAILTVFHSQRGVSLTFDDGPDPIWTPRMLNALLAAEARATFFVVTPLARRYPQLIFEMLERGHTVGFHCAEHIRHTELDRDGIGQDTEVGLKDLGFLGVKPDLWRTPWGITSPDTLEVARKFGLEITGWTQDTHDWRGDTASSMMESIGSSLRPGSVVLMHDGLGPGARRDGCEETVSLIQPLVGRIRELGCEPAPVTSKHTTRQESRV